MKKDKVFTKEEILKVAELAESFNNEMVAKHFGYIPSTFATIKQRQPELNDAYLRGAAIRKSKKYTEIERRNSEKSSGVEKKKSLKKLPCGVVEDSTKEALKNFKEKFEDDKLRRLRKQVESVKLI